MIREKDWSATPLGPIEGWPGSLRTATDMVLGAKIPMIVLWGEDAVLLYNDAYGRVIGEKHPAALGARAREVGPKVWKEAGPVFDSALVTGEATEAGRRALPSKWNGDCWFDHTLNPIRGSDGKVEGVLSIAHEVTSGVEAEAERDQHCEAMRESERRARAFISNLPGGASGGRSRAGTGSGGRGGWACGR